MLKDSLAKMPINILSKVILDDDKVVIPSDIEDTDAFYKDNEQEINSVTPTQEQLVHLNGLVGRKPIQSLSAILSNKIYKS